MTLNVNALTFQAIIGLLAHERLREQRVIVDCRIEYDYRPPHFIDYVDIIALIETTIKERHFKLIEEALCCLETQLHQTFPNISVLELKITKPDIIANATVSLSSTAFFKRS
ncbi:MAG: dihydroneopterin aldolase [Sulfurimonas sp.]|nr:MAG: dihydroneopterin aldolase [Sulfurimonas sp.]